MDSEALISLIAIAVVLAVLGVVLWRTRDRAEDRPWEPPPYDDGQDPPPVVGPPYVPRSVVEDAKPEEWRRAVDERDVRHIR